MCQHTIRTRPLPIITFDFDGKRRFNAESKWAHETRKVIVTTTPSRTHTLLRKRKAGISYDLCREPPLDEHRFTDRRAYCAKCNRVKGSAKTNRYFPERACLSCGSTKTILRDFDGNEIGSEKWVTLQNEAALIKMADCGRITNISLRV